MAKQKENGQDSESNKQPFTCNQCSYSSTCSSNFARHLQTHTGEKPFVCDFCTDVEVRFAHKKHLKKHIMTLHTGEPPLRCETCEFTTASKTTLNRHMMIHQRVQFTCGKCDNQYSQKRKLYDHIIAAHDGEFTFSCAFSCDKCSYTAVAECDFIKHMTAHQEKEKSEQSFKCEFCDFQFHAIDQLTAHTMEHHSGEQRPCVYSCDKCDFTSKNGRGLSRHMLVHNSKRSFKCSMCRWRGKTQWSLDRHTRNMCSKDGTRERPFLCETCNKRFVTRIVLLRHMELHDPANPFRCDKCVFVSKYKSDFVKHMNTHPMAEIILA